MLGEEISGPPLPAVPFHTIPELIAARALAEPSRPAVRYRGPSGRWQDLTWSALDARRVSLRSLEKPVGQNNVEARAKDAAFLLYTSGTTGAPKGVELTHHNVLSQQTSIAAVWDVSDRDVFLCWLPWHHCFGALFERLMALWHRALLVIDDSRGRDLDGLVRNIIDVHPTVYFAVSRVYNGLTVRAKKDAKLREALRSLRFAFSAAAPISQPAFRWFEENGVPVLEGWGLTETSPCATTTRREQPRAPGVVGPPLPGTPVKLGPVEGAP